MKVRPSVKKICEKCKVIKRKGRKKPKDGIYGNEIQWKRWERIIVKEKHIKTYEKWGKTKICGDKRK